MRPRYLALTNERFVADSGDDVSVTRTSIYPDVGVADARPGPAAGGAAVVAAPVRLATVAPTSVPHVTVEIRDTENRELVTAIEVLSPTNKRGAGRREYLTKRRRTLLSSAHLLEIDLLTKGKRVPMRQPLPPAPYYVFVGRAEERPTDGRICDSSGRAVACRARTALAGRRRCAAGLAARLDDVYDLCGYDLAVNYALPPKVRLSAGGGRWVEERLQAAGLRA